MLGQVPQALACTQSILLAQLDLVTIQGYHSANKKENPRHLRVFILSGILVLCVFLCIVIVCMRRSGDNSWELSLPFRYGIFVCGSPFTHRAISLVGFYGFVRARLTVGPKQLGDSIKLDLQSSQLVSFC